MRNTLIELSKSRSLYILRKAVWQAFVCSYGGEMSPVVCSPFFGLPRTTEPWHDQARASPPLNKGVSAASAYTCSNPEGKGAAVPL